MPNMLTLTSRLWELGYLAFESNCSSFPNRIVFSNHAETCSMCKKNLRLLRERTCRRGRRSKQILTASCAVASEIWGLMLHPAELGQKTVRRVRATAARETKPHYHISLLPALQNQTMAPYGHRMVAETGTNRVCAPTAPPSGPKTHGPPVG